MRITRAIAGIVLAALFYGAGFVSSEASQQQRRGAVEEEVRLTLDRYLQARNSFDLDAFMDFFLRSPDLTVVTATSEHIGWDNTRKGIAPFFQARSTTSEFSDIRVFPVTRDIAIVHHHYVLKSARGSGNPSRSTKVFQRTANNWRVVAEHSSRIPEFVR